MESELSIDEVAKRTGLTAHTLRYYERIGLIAPVARAPGGQRRYAASDLAWIGFLLRLRETRMSIGQMLVFAELRGEGNATVPERRQMLETHLAGVLESIIVMRRSVKALQTKIVHYQVVERSVLPNSSPGKEPHDERTNRSTQRRTPGDRQRTLQKGTRQAARD